MSGSVQFPQPCALPPGSDFLERLALLFIALRLLGFTDWPWIWVLAPLWVPLGLGMALFAALSLAVLFRTSRTDKPGQPSSVV